MEKWVGCVAVVTGASSGIGRALSVRLAEEGMQVAALARREHRLQELASSFKGKGEIRPYKCDITDDAEISRTFSNIEQNMGPIRVLVNNAGVALINNIMDFEIDKWRQIFDVNLFAVFSCVKVLLNSVRKNNSTELVHIININSVAGQYYMNVPGIAAYSSSKQCSTLLTRGLTNMVAQQNLNIRVTSVSPGAVESEIVGRDDYSAIPHLEIEDVAEATISVLTAPDTVIISELMIRPKGGIY